MNMFRWIVSQSLLWAVSAILLVVAPETILGWFDMQQIPNLHALARVFGSELMGLALVSYFTRDLVYTPERKRLALAYLISNTLGFAATTGAIMQAAIGGVAWALASLYAIYALAFAYYFFGPGKEYERPPEGVRRLFG